MTSAIRRVARAAGRAVRSAAGGLSKWREELHPRDRLGRFRDKWKLSPKASAQLNRVLNAFNPRAVDDMFDSNDDAQNYARGIHATQRKRWTPAQSATLDKFFRVDKDGVLGRDDVDAVVNDNRSSPEVKNLDDMMQPLPEDVVLTQVVGAEAFGLPPERIAEVEEWTGKLAMSKSYSPTNMGMPNSTVTGPHVTMSFLTPKGTKAAVDKNGNVLLDRETPFRITHVDPDGKGGQTVYAVVMPKSGNKEPARALGKALPDREKAPAVDATPEEFEKRGLDPETGEPIEQAVPPAPKAAPAKAQGTARQIREAGGEVPTGAGRVTREGDEAPEAEEPPARETLRAAETDRAERATRARRALEERQRQEGTAGTVRERIQQEHQAVVRATPVAKGLSDVHEAIGRGGNDQSIADRLRAQASSDEILRIDDDDEQSRIVEELEQAAQEMESGDRPAALRRLDRLARTQNIERIHEPEEEVEFDDVSMEFIGDGPRPVAGDRVRVTRPGSRFIRRRDGNVIPIERPQVVRAEAPSAQAPVAPAQTGLPSSRGGTDIAGLTEGQKRAVLARVRLMSREPGFPRNDEQRRVQRLADDIMAERAGLGRRRQAAEEVAEAPDAEAPEVAPTPAKATRAAKRAAGEAPAKRVPRAPSKRLPRAERQALAKSTPAQIRRAAARRGVTDLQGETPAELVDDLMRRLAAEDRGGDVVKKALPKKVGRKAAAKALPEPGSREELEGLGVGPDDLQTDVPNLRLVRDAKTLGDINTLAKDMGVRIPSSIGRREDRREFLRRAVAILPGESEEDYGSRIAEMRGAPAKKAVAKAEAATRKAAKKAEKAVKAAAPEVPAKKVAKKAPTEPAKKVAAKKVAAKKAPPTRAARVNEALDQARRGARSGNPYLIIPSFENLTDADWRSMSPEDRDRVLDAARSIDRRYGNADGTKTTEANDRVRAFLARRGEAAPAKKAAKKAPVSGIAARRRQAVESLREQGFENPSQEMIEEQMRALADIEARDLIRERSGGGVAKKAAKKAVPEPTKATAAKALRVTRSDPLRAGDRVEWTPSPESGEEPLQGTVVKVPSQTGRTERTFIDWDSGIRESSGATRPGAGVRRIARAPEAPEPAKAAKKVAKKAAKAAPEPPTKQVAKKAAKVAAPQAPAKKAAKAAPRLTPNQRFMMDRVETRSKSRRGIANDGWVDADVVGSKATLENLHGKGLLERREERGPRGGLKRFYRPVPAEQRSRGVTERVAPPVGAPVAKRLAKKAAPEKATKKAAAAKKAQDARVRAATRERVAADIAETRRQQKIAAKAPGAKKVAKKAAPEVRLTANQESLRDRVAELSPQGDDGWVNAADIGSPATLRTLAAKGVLEEMETPGARGRGVQRWYRPAGMRGAKKAAPVAVKKAAPKAAKKAAGIGGTRLAPTTTGPTAATPTARRVAKQLQDGEITPAEAAAALTRPTKRAPTKALPTKQEIGAWRTRDEAQEAIADLKNDQLRALLDREGVTYGSRDNKTQLRDRVAQSLVGQRAIDQALSRSAEESQAKRTATQALKKAAPRASLAREIRPGDRIMVNRTPEGIRPATRVGEGEPFEVSDVQDYPSPRGGALGRILITGRDQNGDIAEVNFDRAGGLRPSQMLRRAPDSAVDIPSVAQGAKKAVPEAPAAPVVPTRVAKKTTPTAPETSAVAKKAAPAAPTEAPFLRERRNRLREQFDEILRDGANVPGFDDRPSDGFASPREVVQQWIDGLEQAPPDMQISRGSLREAARRFQRLDNVRISNLFNRAEQRLSESQGERPDLSNVPKDTQQRFGRLGPGAQARAERAMAALHQDDVQMRGDLGRPLARAKKDLLAGTHPNDVKRDLRIASRFLRERNEGNDSAAADRYDRMVDGISPSGRMERDLATAPALPKPEATGQPDYWYDEAVRERLFPGILVASDPENDIRRGLVVRLGDADEDETGRAPKWGWIRKVDDNGDVIIDVPDGERRIVERDVVEDWIRNYAPEGRVLQGGSELIPAQRAVRDVQGILDNITGNRSLTAEERNRIVDAMSGLTRGHNGDDLELVQVTRNLRNNPSRPEDVDRVLAIMGRRLGVEVPRRQNRAFAPPPPEKRTTREVLESARREAAKRVAARQAPAASTVTPEGPLESTDPQDNVRKVAALLEGETPAVVPLYRVGRDRQVTDVGAITRRNRGDHDFTVIKPTDGSSPGWITRDTGLPNRWRVIERTDSGGERLIGFAPSPEIGADVLVNGEDRARRGKIVGDFRRALTTAPDGRTVEVEPRKVAKAVTPAKATPEAAGPDLPASELPVELRGPVPTTRDVLSMAATKRWAAANGFRGDVGRGNWIRDRNGTAVANGWTAFQRLQEWRARQPQGRTNRELLDGFTRPGAPGAKRAKALAKATKAVTPAPTPRAAPEPRAAPTPAKAAPSARSNDQLRRLFDSARPTDNADKVDNVLAQRGTGSDLEGRSVSLFRRGADGQDVQVGRISTRDAGDGELRVSSLSAGPVGRIHRSQGGNWVAVDNDGRITGIAANPETAVDALVNGAERANARPGASFRAVKKAAKAAEASAALARALRRGETAPANQVRQQLLDAPDLDARRKVLTDLEMNNTQARKLARDLGVSRLGRGQADEIVEGLADTFEANVRDRDRDLTPTSPVKKAAKATKATASQIDESAPLARDPEGDGMYMHGDSASMNLAQALARKGRNGSANRIMDLRRRTSLQDDNGQYAPVSEMLDEMRRMRDAETDPDLIRQIDDSIERIDGPDTPVPDLPDNTPPLARRLIEDLNEIPYARKRKGDRTSAGSFQYEKSIVEQAADAIRDAAIGRRDDTRRSPADRLRNILRDRVHESNDGSLQIWKLAERLDDGKLSDPDSLPGSLRALERGAQTPAPPVGAPAPPDPSVDLSPGDGLPVTTRLAAERALGNAPGARNTLNRLDSMTRMPGDRHQVPALMRQVDQELQRAGSTPDEKPRRELREWFERHFPDGAANRAARVEGAMAPRKAAPETAEAPRNNYIGQTISGSQVESLRPGDVVEFPRTPREAARRATVAKVENGTATMEDGSRVSAHTGRKVRVIEQQGLEAPPAAPAKRTTKATRAAERAVEKATPETEAPAAAEVTPETATSATRVRPRDIAVGDLIPETTSLPPSRAPRFEDGNAVWDLPSAPGAPRAPRAYPLKRVASIRRAGGASNRFEFLDENGDVINSVSPNSHVWRASRGRGAPAVKKAAAPAAKKAAPEAPEAPPAKKAAPEAPPAKKAAEPIKAATTADLKPRPDPTPGQSDEDIRDQAEAEFNRLQGLRGLQGEDVSNQAMLQNRERLRLRGARNRIEAARPRPEGVADRMAWRQANIDAKRPVANSLSELNELVDNEASTEALRSRLRSGGYELHPKVLKQLQDAVDTGNKDKIAAAIDRVAGDHSLTRTTGPAGSIEPFDTDLHRRLDNKERLFPGTMVRVTRPGYWSEIEGERIALSDNIVEAATTAEVAEARRLSPTQVDNRVRAAYRAALAKKTDGDNRWVGLAELRQELGGSLSREQVDASLRRLVDGRNNRLIPEENQKTITSGDRDAAISLNGEPKHLISMTDASSSDVPEKGEAPKATSRWNVDPKPFGNFTPTNDRAWGREEQSRNTFFPKEPVARDADNIKVGEVVPIAGDNANWGVVTEAIVQGQRNSDVIRVREPGMTPRLVSKSLTKEKVRQNAAERAWREAGGLNPGESTADERAQRLAKTAEAPAKAATPPAKKAVPEAPTPSKALAPTKATPARGLPGDQPLSQDEMLTLQDVSARGRFTRDGEGGWVRRGSVRATLRENLDKLADDGWLDRQSSPDGDFFRISPTGRPAPQGDVLEGQVLSRPLEPEHRLPLNGVNRGAVIHGYRDPENPSRFTNVPETGADPSRIARIVVQRIERVTEKGDTEGGLFEKTHGRIVGHDADTGRRMDSDIESMGSHWDWEANPDTDTSPDIEGEVVPEAPVRKAVKAAKAAAPEAPAETDAGRRFLTREEIAPETESAPDFNAREFPKLPAPTRQGLHQIRLPDGTMAERTSKTRNYTHAVVVEQDNRLSASNLRQQVEVGKRHQQDYEDAIRTGDWSKFRKVTASHSANDERAGRVGTDYVRKDDTRKYPERYANPDPNDWSNRKYSKEFDDRNDKTAAEVAARSVQSQREYQQRLWDRSMAEADALDAGPEKSYGVYRWSSSAANARSALNAADLPEGPDLKKRVVEVGSDMSGGGTGVRRVGVSKGRVSAARQADEAAAAAKKAVPTAKEAGMDRTGRLSDMNAPSDRAPEDGVDRFDGIARSGWLKEARRTKTAVPRSAPAHEIARLVGEKQARDSASTSWVLRYGGRGQSTDEDYNAVTGKMEKALSKDEYVERAVKRFGDDHNAKLRELGVDPVSGALTKKAAKKAATPSAPGVGTADTDDLEGPRVLKQTLLDIAAAEGVDDVRPTWTKPRIRDAIRRARADRAIDTTPSRIDAPDGSKAAPVKALRKAAVPTEAPKTGVPEEPGPSTGVKSINDIRVPIGERPEGYDVILDARQGSFDGPSGERRLVSRLDVERTPALRNVAKLLGLNPKSSDRRVDLQRMLRDEIARQRGVDLTPESPVRRELEKLGRAELLKRLEAKGLKAPLRAKNNRLVDLLADDEPRGKYHVKEDAPIKNLRRMAESPDTRDERHFGDGLDAEVTLVRNGDKEAIRKRYVPDGMTDAKARTDSESLGAQVAKAIEADSPTIFRPSERTIFMDRVPGKPGGRFNDAEQLAVAQTPGGKRIALLDALTGHSDRHRGNWIRKPDGSPVAIDNGIMFKSSARDGDDFLPVPSHSDDVFNNHYGTIVNGPSDQFNLPKSATWGTIPWSKQELEGVRPKLQALRPDFELIGRGDWHDDMMGRLDTMIRKADDGPELPAAPRVAKKVVKAAAPAPAVTPDVPGTASSPQRRVRKVAAPAAPEPVEEAEDFPEEDLVQRFLEDVDAGTITRAGEVRHGLLHFKGKQLRDLHKQLGGDGSGPIGDVRNDVASRVRKKLGIPTRADDRKREELDALSRDELKAMVPEDERRGSGAMGREDLINTIIGDGTRGDFHGTPDPDVQQLKADLGTKPTVTRNFGQGSMGTVSQVEGRNGRPAVRKRLATGWILPAEHQADAENLYSRVGRAMGIDTPTVYQPTSRTVYMDYIDDMTLARNATPEQIAQAVQSDMGRRILLSDVLTAQEDRMEFNWGIRSNGEPVVFDNAMSFRHDSMPDPDNDDDVLPSLRIPDAFNEHYGVVVGGYEGQDPSALRWGNIPWTKSELRKVQRQIKPLKADFEKLGRGDWYDQMDQRLKTLIRKAPETLPEARPVGAPTAPAPGRAARGMARSMGVEIPTATGPKKVGSAPTQPRAPQAGPSVGRARVPGRVGQSADLRRPSDRQPVTGTIDVTKMNLPNDTGPLGRPVRDLDIRTAQGNYRMASGTAWRENGFTITVEHADTPEGILQAAEARKKVTGYVQSLPAELRPLLTAVTVAENASPDELYWRDRFNVPTFQVMAQAGGGSIAVWRRDWTMNDPDRPLNATLDHEMGHIVDQKMAQLRSDDQAWRDAVADDDNRIDRHLGPGPASHSRSDRNRRRRRRPNIPGDGGGGMDGGGGFPDGFSPFHGLPHFDFPNLRKRKGRRKGVTPYGAMNSREDFAESTMLYLKGPIGLGTFNGRMTQEPIWFSDLFPGRTAVLDQVFPSIAAQRKRQIKQIRQMPIHQRATAIRNAAGPMGPPLVQEYQSPPPQQRAPRDLAPDVSTGILRGGRVAPSRSEITSQVQSGTADEARAYLDELRIEFELLPLARALGIRGTGSMRKAELIEAIISATGTR